MRVPPSCWNLREIKLEVTYRCSLACVHCSSDASPSATAEMGREECLNILTQARDMGIQKVAFSGGEPLEWTPLNEAVGFASQGGATTIVYTSGNGPDVERKLASLQRAGVSTCVFSIFGACSRTHERITHVRGSHDRTLQAMKCANRNGIRTELHFVPLACNYRELEPIVRLGAGYGVGRVSVLRFVPQGRGADLPGQVMDRRQNLELKATVRALRAQRFDVRTGSPYNFLMVNEQPRCYAAIDRLIVAPDLSIYPCDAFKRIRAEELVGTLEFSSLRTATLVECWKSSPYLNAVRHHLEAPLAEPCASCDALGQCGSGCLAQRLIAYGDLESRPDPGCLKS
jgi:radical SAM protein with 4Fe4S-binding SPASM domain